MSSFRGKSALVTGASSGLGEQFARQLAQRGAAHLVLTALPDPHLEELQIELLAEHPGLQVDVISGDFSAKENVDALLEHLDAIAFSPDILINNAGFGDLGPFQSSKPRINEAMLALNVITLTRLTRWALPDMLERRSGWICHVGSTSGFLPTVTSAVYGASKAYVNSFSEALRVEVRALGVHVLTLCPGPVHTGFSKVATRPKGKWTFNPPAFFYVDKAIVVRQTLHALERRQGRIVPGLSIRFCTILSECLPRWLLRALSNLIVDSRRKR